MARKPKLPTPPPDLPAADEPSPEVAAILATLPPKRAAFVLYYHLTRNATKAAEQAGYSPKTARQQGSRLLSDADISAAIEKLQEQQAARIGVSRDWIEQRLVTVVERCLEAEPVLDEDGNPTGVYRFDARGANGALKLLGEMHGVYVKVQETRNLTVEDMIRRLAERRRQTQ